MGAAVTGAGWNPTQIDGAALQSLLPPADAVAAIEAALANGLDPEEDAARILSGLPTGEFLLMPSHSSAFAGVKVATVAPDNPAHGRPKIQGVYLLFDATSLTPLAVMDGTELTLIRTPAVTVTAIKHLLLAGGNGLRVPRMAIIGTSVQAWHHLVTAAAVLQIDETVIIGRRPDAAARLAARASDAGIPARAADASGLGSADLNSAELNGADLNGADLNSADLNSADVIICATSSRAPVFDSARIKPSAVVAAIGSHGLDAREIDEPLARRADVVVEGRASALREAGDLIPARSAEEWELLKPANLADLVAGRVRRRPETPALYTGVGMSWQDLVIAGEAYTRSVGRHAP